MSYIADASRKARPLIGYFGSLRGVLRCRPHSCSTASACSRWISPRAARSIYITVVNSK